jgi:prepilin peptidase CpaA
VATVGDLRGKDKTMHAINTNASGLLNHWPVWLVAVALVVAAIIDGIKLKVPNWLTFPFIISGWVYSLAWFGWEGLGWSLLGTVVGLGLLLPAYAIGGMGAGDVKLLAGVGAWMHATHTFWAFTYTVVVGALLALGMVLYRRAAKKHALQFWLILQEIMTIRDPSQLASMAADRKSSMLLLPYGIPIAIGTITYFFWEGLFI